MANTVTVTTLERSSRKIVLYVTILGNAAAETNTLIYDSSVQTALIKDPQTGNTMIDPLHCRIWEIEYANTCASASTFLSFDASTKVVACGLPHAKNGNLCFEDVGGIPDYAGSGITGDILITTPTVAAGETITFILTVIPV